MKHTVISDSVDSSGNGTLIVRFTWATEYGRVVLTLTVHYQDASVESVNANVDGYQNLIFCPDVQKELNTVITEYRYA